jgi:L-lactate dehydrogenase complex protein LldG
MNYDKYFDELLEKAYEPFLQTAIVRATGHYFDRRSKNFPKLPHLQDWVDEYKGIRRAQLDKVPQYIKQAKESMEERGLKVYMADTAKQANEIILKILGDAKIVLKAKSLTSEEIGMNEFLEEHGIHPIETDVGALLLQLMHGKAMHPTGVSIAVPREVAAEYFSKLAGKKLPSDPPALVTFVREYLRKKMLEADYAFSGANAITADTGTIYLVTNEGNARLITSIAPKHVVLAGIEKVMPNRHTADLYSWIMPPYVTGAASIIYLSQIGGISTSNDIERVSVAPAAGPSELHVVLMDNGRSRMLADPHFRDAFTCLKCGACLMDCPIWNVVAGYFGEHTYMGPFGIVWTAFTKGLEAAATQAYTCTLCGKCKEVCPMGIDTPRMVRKIRQMLAEKNLVPDQATMVVENILKYGTPYAQR